MNDAQSSQLAIDPAALPLPPYAALGYPYHVPVAPTPLPTPALLHFNTELAAELGIATPDERLLAILSGNQPWPDYEPLASVYAGHQFGQFVPQLGDGRALTIAEVHDRHGRRRELQLKGAGPTPFSRRADGRAVLRSSIREYLASEAMHALGVPTTRCLSLVGSPLPVRRERYESAAVVCRVSPSFVRFGSFEFFYYRGAHEYLAPLAEHVIGEHFPDLAAIAEPQHRYRVWLTEVVDRTARLMAQWQSLGFCHGVMNTDNFSILGLTIDYGPFGFVDAFNHQHICNHSDDQGRYAYNEQPEIGGWNCLRLLQSCLPLLAVRDDEAEAVALAIYRRYHDTYSDAARQHWRAKLGLDREEEGDPDLVNGLLTLMQAGGSDFTRSFRQLARIRRDDDGPAHGVRDEFADLAAFDAWVASYRARLRREGRDDTARAAAMNAVNPKYVLRNHLAQAAIERAEAGDLSEVEQLMQVLTRPFAEQPEFERYAAEPPEDARHIAVSCSS